MLVDILTQPVAYIEDSEIMNMVRISDRERESYYVNLGLSHLDPFVIGIMKNVYNLCGEKFTSDELRDEFHALIIGKKWYTKEEENALTALNVYAKLREFIDRMKRKNGVRARQTAVYLDLKNTEKHVVEYIVGMMEEMEQKIYQKELCVYLLISESAFPIVENILMKSGIIYIGSKPVFENSLLRELLRYIAEDNGNCWLRCYEKDCRLKQDDCGACRNEPVAEFLNRKIFHNGEKYIDKNMELDEESLFVETE